MLKEGDYAPNFALKCTSGNYHNISEFLGKKIVLFFYPKDNTSNCTIESCGFRDDYKDIRLKNTIIIGVSPDGVQSHINFKEQHKLPFMLLSDQDYSAAKKYEVLRKVLGFRTKQIIRSTFIIDESGKINKVFSNVNVLGHSKEILSYL